MDIHKAYVALPSLDASDVRSVKLAVMCQLLLRELELSSKSADAIAELKKLFRHALSILI